MRRVGILLCILVAAALAGCCDSEAACASVEPGMSQSEALEPFCPGTTYDVLAGRFDITAPDGSTCRCPTSLNGGTISEPCSYTPAAD